MGKITKNSVFKQMLLLAVLIAVTPLLIKTGYVLSIMVFVGINAIVVLGMVVLMGYTGQVSLGHSAFMAIGAYTSAILTTSLGISPWLSMVAAVIMTMAISLLIGFATLRVKGYYLALATMAFGLLVYRVLLELNNLTGGTSGIRDIPGLTLGSMAVNTDLEYYFLVWTAVLIVFFFTVNITKSPYGLFMIGVELDEVAVSVLGINVFGVKMKALLFSAGTAGFGGALYSHYVKFISPEVFVMDRAILFLMMIIVGGSRYPWGGIIGALLLTFIPEYLRAYRDISIGIYGLIMILIILYLPGGIASISKVVPNLLNELKAKRKMVN